MPHREQAPAGAPCWIELFTSDHERSRAFYGELFGWTSEEPQEQFGGYYLVDARDLDDALAIASRIPTACNGSVEVRPLAIHNL